MLFNCFILLSYIYLTHPSNLTHVSYHTQLILIILFYSSHHNSITYVLCYSSCSSNPHTHLSLLLLQSHSFYLVLFIFTYRINLPFIILTIVTHDILLSILIQHTLSDYLTHLTPFHLLLVCLTRLILSF